MNFYERNIVPRLVDLLCGVKAIRMQRAKIVPLAAGRVLEPGLGTGRNLAFYQAEQIEYICGVDPAVELNSLSKRRIKASGLPVELLPLSAETLPAEDDSFDNIVLTYTLCSIPEPIQALREMRRVLKPGGQLLFCEHGAAPDLGVRRWQDRLTPTWRKIAGNCHMNREIKNLLEAAGFQIQTLETGYIPGPRILTYNYWGIAV